MYMDISNAALKIKVHEVYFLYQLVDKFLCFRTVRFQLINCKFKMSMEMIMLS